MSKSLQTVTSCQEKVTTLSTLSRLRTLTKSSHSTDHVGLDPLPSSVSVLIIVATKLGAIVGGQTSCKAPEIAAFEKHLPKDVDIVSCHSLHGPGVNPKGQPLVRLDKTAETEC